MPRPRNDQFTKDQFFFWRHDPGKGPLSANEWKLEFEAHLTGLSESSSPSWSENFDMGRADPKMFYSSYQRTLNLSFMVIALNEEEHIENMDKLEKLAKFTMPIYQSGNGYNAPHVFYQVGSLLGGYGVIMNYDPNYNPVDHPWISNRPVYIEINMSIKVLADVNGARPNADKSRWFI